LRCGRCGPRSACRHRTSIARRGIEGDGAGKIIQPEIETGAGFEKLADFVIGFVAAEDGIDFDENKLGDTQANGTANFPGDELG
jgi:hypothetical protein